MGVLVRLPTDSHRLLVLISVVINMCPYTYDSAATYQTILTRSNTNLSKVNLSGFLMRIRHFSKSYPSVPKLKQWYRRSPCFYLPVCKKIMFSSGLILNDDPRSEMTSDLLNLASASNSENDLPEVFQWMTNDMPAFDKSKSPKCWLEKEVGVVNYL